MKSTPAILLLWLGMISAAGAQSIQWFKADAGSRKGKSPRALRRIDHDEGLKKAETDGRMVMLAIGDWA